MFLIQLPGNIWIISLKSFKVTPVWCFYNTGGFYNKKHFYFCCLTSSISRVYGSTRTPGLVLLWRKSIMRLSRADYIIFFWQIEWCLLVMGVKASRITDISTVFPATCRSQQKRTYPSSTTLVLCRNNLLVNDKYPSERASNAESFIM